MTIVGGESTVLACGATLASILWVGVTVPNLALVSSSGGPASERIAISLQSALLGIDDRVDRTKQSAAIAALGLTPTDAQRLSANLQSRTSGNSSAADATSPLVVAIRSGV